MNTAIERRREAKQRESSNLEAKQRLFGGRALVERREEPNRNVEHSWLWLVIRQALTNHCQPCAGGPDRPQAPKYFVKRSIDRDLL